MVNYNSYDSASLGTSEDGDLVHGYGEDGDLASVAFDQDSNTLIVSDSETPAVQVPTETSTSSSDAHREDYAAPPALPDTGSHVNSRSGMVTMPCPAHGTSVYPYRVRVGDESCGAEYIEYADVPDDNLPEVSNGSSEDSPQLDDTSERSIRKS